MNLQKTKTAILRRGKLWGTNIWGVNNRGEPFPQGKIIFNAFSAKLTIMKCLADTPYIAYEIAR
jgi:hypothetical protein